MIPEGGLEIGAIGAALRNRAVGGSGADRPSHHRYLIHSNVRVRNVATIGGNLAHADPHMDLPPVLIALGASVRAVKPGGERTIPSRICFPATWQRCWRTTN